MDFTKIAQMQKQLDASYQSNGSFKEPYVDQKRILALLVEIGEFANEYEPFKYWKAQKKFNRDLIIGEFVDGIHFFTSMINLNNVVISNVNYKIASEDKSLQLLHTFKAVTKLFEEINKPNLLEAFSLYLGNAKLLNIEFHEIEAAYIAKNKVNFERIKRGY